MAKELKMAIGVLERPLNCIGCASRSIWEGNSPRTIYLTITPTDNSGNSSPTLNFCYLCAREKMISLSRDLDNAWNETYNKDYKEFKHRE